MRSPAPHIKLIELDQEAEKDGLQRKKFDFVISERESLNSKDDGPDELPKFKVDSDHHSMQSVDAGSKYSDLSIQKENPNFLPKVAEAVNNHIKRNLKYPSHRDVVVRAISSKPSERNIAASSFDNHPQVQQKPRLSVTGMNQLRTMLNSRHVSKVGSPTREQDILLNRLNDNFLDENFMENEREYVYKTWNHIKQNSLTNFTRTARQYREKKVKPSDFIKQEQEWKNVLERRKSKHIIRDVCLEYEYSPDYCFNSMIDVLTHIKLVKPIDSIVQENLTKEDKDLKHVYRARIFKLPRDSLHSEYEFPLGSRPGKSGYLMNFHRRQQTDISDEYMMTETDLSATPSRKNLRCSMRKIEKDRHQLATTIDSLHRKKFLVIKEGDMGKTSTEQVEVKRTDTELARLHEWFGQERPVDRNVFRGRRSSRRKAVYEHSMVDLLYEKYLNDFVEVDKAVVKVTKGDNLELLYEGIRARELERGVINDLNYSGEQVLSRANYPDYLTNCVVSSLNNQETLIWVRRISGIIEFLDTRLRRFCSSYLFETFMAVCTILNVLVLIGDGLYSEHIQRIGMKINFALTFVYQVELLLKLRAFGIKWYLQSYVNVLECIVTIIATVEITISSSDNSIENNKNFLSAFRVLRLTRLLSKMKFMGVIHAVVVETFEQYIYVALLLIIFLFIFGLIGMQIFGSQLIYKDRLPRQNFDSLLASFFSLFQLLTLENWTDIVEILFKSTVPRWVTLLYVITWIVIGNYIIFNLFLALLLSGFDNVDLLAAVQEETDAYQQIHNEMLMKYQTLRLEKEVLKRKLENQERDIEEILQEGHNKKFIMDDEIYIAEHDTQRKKERAVFFPVRNTIDDESSLEHLFEQAVRDHTMPKKNFHTMENIELLFSGVESEFALGMFPKTSYYRRFCAYIITSKPFEYLMILTILISTLTLVVETYLDKFQQTNAVAIPLKTFESLYLLVFVLESHFKIIRSGLVNEKNTYLRDPWSWLEMIVIIGSAVEIMIASSSFSFWKVNFS